MLVASVAGGLGGASAVARSTSVSVIARLRVGIRRTNDKGGQREDREQDDSCPFKVFPDAVHGIAGPFVPDFHFFHS
jgi:hypothetical protein